MIYKTISTRDIISDEQFRISLKRNYEQLTESIKNFGLKNPPVLNKENDKYYLISGFKRLDIMKEIGIKKLEFIVIDKPMSVCEKLIFNINDNLAIRELTLYEKILSIKKLNENGCKDIDKFIPLLKINSGLIDIFDKIKFSYEFLEIIDKNDFDKRTFFFLKYFNKRHIASIIKIFTNNQFTKSEKRKFIDMLLRADEMSIDITKFLNDNINNKKQILIEQLFKLIQPETEKLKEKFYILQKELKGVKLRAEPYFEDPDLKIEIKFKDYESLRKKLEKLKTQIKNKTGNWYED